MIVTAGRHALTIPIATSRVTVLQFNGTSTWGEAEDRFAFRGNPMIPADAIHMADMMIDAGMAEDGLVGDFWAFIIDDHSKNMF